MTSTDWAQTQPIAPAELPQVISRYLAAHSVRDTETAMACLTSDATITDEGHTYSGHDAIGRWLREAASEYTYTTELISASRADDSHYDAVHHLAGDFPGGEVDLHFRFSLSGGLIQELVIEP